MAAGGQSRGVAGVTMLPLKPVIAVLAFVTVATAAKLETLGRLHLLPQARRTARRNMVFHGMKILAIPLFTKRIYGIIENTGNMRDRTYCLVCPASRARRRRDRTRVISPSLTLHL